MAYYYTDELFHYGIKGMKWGVRRYRNYDGSLTKAGLERYDHSVSVYEKRKAEYDSKKSVGFKSDYERRLAKAKVKEAKSQVKKDYKHLKQDKMADEGKILYKSGVRIRDKKRTTNLMRSVGSLTISAALYGSKYGINKVPIPHGAFYPNYKGIALAGAALVGASFVKDYIDEAPNRKLRAYYDHTSNY